uniref:Uncharacterized protein n=1 Tax=Knipowitschia caucasica TaxID=637954 RepID=A0AAV2KBQ1_KNICA
MNKMEENRCGRKEKGFCGRAFPYGDESCSLVSPEKDRFSLRSELKPHQRRGFLLVPQTFYQKKRLHCTVLDQLTGDQKVFKVPQDLYLTSSAAAVVTTVTVTVRPTIVPEETRETPLSSIRLRVVAGLVAAVGPALVILALVKVWCRCRKGEQR